MSEGNGRTVMVEGRIVWTSGDLFKGRPKKDQNGNQRTNKNGEPMNEYGFGLAVDKNVFGTSEVWAAMNAEAQSLYPNGQIPPNFSMKYKDGDGVDHKGQSYANRAGHAGHVILACTQTLPIKWFKFENGNNIMINEGIKCGDYVQVQLGVKAHAAIGQAKAGLYLNPMAVRLTGYGEAIVNAPSGDDIFGTTAPTTPQGASATPLAPAAPMPGVAAPAMPAAQPQAPQAPATPHYGVLPEQHQPQQMPAAPQAPVNVPQTNAMPAAPVQSAPMPNAAPAAPQPPQMPPATPGSFG